MEIHFVTAGESSSTVPIYRTSRYYEVHI